MRVRNCLRAIYSNYIASDYKDDGSNILLDANENAYGPSLELDNLRDTPNGHEDGTISSAAAFDWRRLNRYPDPYVLGTSKASLLC